MNGDGGGDTNISLMAAATCWAQLEECGAGPSLLKYNFSINWAKFF